MDENFDKIDKIKYEQAVSECQKFFTFIKIVVWRNIKVLTKTEYNHVRTEYGEFINAYEISNGDDSIADVQNEYNPQQVTDKKHGKYQNSLITDDNRKLSESRNVSRNLKEKFHIHKCKHNASLTFYHENYTKTLEDVCLITNQNTFMNMKQRCYQKPLHMFNKIFGKYFKLNKYVSFIVSDIFLGSLLIILRMPWCKSTKQFRGDLALVIKKYF